MTRQARLVFVAGSFSILAAGLLLRLYRAGAQELWVDETFSFFAATLPDALRYLSIDSTPPLYYVLLRAWVGLAGADELGLRLLSVVLGTLTVGAAIWIGRRWFSPVAGLCSGLFVATAPHHVYYSQEARTYVLLVLLLLVTHAAFWRAVDKRSTGAWIAATLCATAALYAHYFALIALLPTALLPLFRRERSRWRPCAASVAAACLLAAPWAVWNWIAKSRVLDGGSPIAWIRSGWLETPPGLAVFKSLEVLGLGTFGGFLPLKLKQFDALQFPEHLRALGLVALAGLALTVLWPWSAEGREKKRYLLAAMLVPLFVLWAISFVRPLYVAGRSDLVAFPAYALLVGAGLARLGGRGRPGAAAAVSLGLLLLVANGAKLSWYYEAEPTTRRHETAAAVADTAREGDLVIFTGLRGPGVLYYLDRAGIRWRDGECVEDGTGRRFGCRLYPIKTEAVLTARIVAPGEDGQALARADVDRYLRGLDLERATVWVVFDGMTDLEGLLVRELGRRGLAPAVANRHLQIAGFARENGASIPGQP